MALVGLEVVQLKANEFAHGERSAAAPAAREFQSNFSCNRFKTKSLLTKQLWRRSTRGVAQMESRQYHTMGSIQSSSLMGGAAQITKFPDDA